MRTDFEVIIVGSGIAGASLAYFLSARGMTDVLLLEREEHPGYHSTGRSAATVVEWDSVPELRELKILGAAWLRKPPAGFSEHRLLDPAGILVTAQEPFWSALQAMGPSIAARGTAVRLLSRAEVVARFPVLSPDHLDGGLFLCEDGHLDVHELLWSYLRHAGRRGVERRCGVEVRAIRVEAGRVRGLETTAGELTARWIVDAAGAWAAKVGALAGAVSAPLTPHRRTIITFAAPAGLDVRGWPLIHNETHHLYFGPESGGLLASPMDEDPMEPCDAKPDEAVVAVAIERLRKVAPTLVPKALRRTWSGLRTFTPDRILVVGEDPLVKGFFWLAGQGGCGIETSPAVAQIAADLLLDGRTGRFEAARLSPRRFLP